MFYKGYLFFYCVLVFLDGGYRFFLVGDFDFWWFVLEI